MEEESLEKFSKNLINNFINPYNGDFLKEVYFILRNIDKKAVEINILKEKITPSDVDAESLIQIVAYSKKCLYKDLEASLYYKNKLKKAILKIVFVNINNLEISTEIEYDNQTYNLKNKLKFKNIK